MHLKGRPGHGSYEDHRSSLILLPARLQVWLCPCYDIDEMDNVEEHALESSC